MIHPQPELPRDHSLDAMRASAMLLGIVFHAAWMYVPAQNGAPVIDVGANDWMSFLFFWTHQFRMHAFIFIAGFFAAMVCHRRGWREFAAQRLRRIGLPLVVGWLFCYPAWVFCQRWGTTASGGAMDGISPWAKTVSHFTTWSDFAQNYGLTHLWFLCTLLLLYAVTLLGGFLLQCLFGRKEGRLESWVDGVARFVRSPWALVVVTLATTAVTLPANWDMMPTPWKLIPEVSSFLAYWIYFLAGWLFHSRPVLLEIADRNWKQLLAAGCAVSIGMFAVTGALYRRGQLTDRNTYPFLNQCEFIDWDGFRKDLLAGKDAGESSFAGRVWTRLKAPARQLMAQTEAPTLNQRVGFVVNLDLEILTATNLADGLKWAAPLPAKAAQVLTKPFAQRTLAEVLLLNRLLLETSFPGRIASSTLEKPAYRWGCVGYAVAYCLVGWLLTLGFLGLFRQCFGHPHATWRYFADAAYWMYIVHLPLLFVIEIPIATWQMAWPVKFLLLNAATFGVLIASYHYLVRSTIIGETLNGRRYPFVNPFGRRIEPPATGNLHSST